jgi:hypothetical protein
VLDAVAGGELVERRAGARPARQVVNRRRGAVGQEHDAGLRAQFEQMPGAIVFLVLARLLVFLDQAAFVLVD